MQQKASLSSLLWGSSVNQAGRHLLDEREGGGQRKGGRVEMLGLFT